MKTLNGFILAATVAAAPFAYAEYIGGSLRDSCSAMLRVEWQYAIDTSTRTAEISGLMIEPDPSSYDPETGELILAPETICLNLTVPDSVELPPGSDYPELNGVTTFPVTAISSGAFSGLNFYQEYVSAIEFDFSYAPLVTIGQGTFMPTGGSPAIRIASGTSLPATLKRIENSAFAGLDCSGMSSTLPAALEYIGYQAFGSPGAAGLPVQEADSSGVYWLDGWVVGYDYSASSGTAVSRRRLDLSAAKGIAGGVFENATQIHSVVLPSGIKSIAEYTFAGCTSLGQTSGRNAITIPASVTNIEFAAFMGCSMLTNFVFEGNAPAVGEYAFYGVGTEALDMPRETCVATVQRGTSGWGDVPGVWNGLYTEYAESATPTYTVTWKNDDGTVLERDTGLLAGATPTYNGGMPYKADTPQYTYLFDGWTPTIEAVVSNTTYTAVYTPFAKWYAVTWLDEDGSQIDLTSYRYGETPSHVGAAKAAEPPYTYTFAGWSPAIVPVTEVTSYTATYTRTADLSTLTGDFTSTDGDVLTNSTTHVVTIPAGATVTINGVTVAGAGGGAASPAAFAEGGQAITAGIAKGANGKWTITAFAELESGTAEGLEDAQVKVIRADTPAGLKTATPMTDGVTVKEKKNAVKVELDVDVPANAPAQFFKVQFGE